MSKVIYLDVDEEITSVIDRIKKVQDNKNKEIILYFPRRASLIKSIVNLKLLKKQIDLLDKSILVVTPDETGMSLAKKSGFKVKKNLEKKENGDNNANEIDFEKKYNKKNKVDIEKFLRKDNDVRAEDKDRKFLQEKNSKNKEGIKKKKAKQFLSFLGNKKNDKKKRASKKSREGKVVLLPSFGFRSLLFFFLISFVLISIIFFVVLPKATIIVVPKTEPFSSDMELSVSGEVEGLDIKNKIIPGNLEEVELKSEKIQFDSSGEKDVGVKAQGTVTLYNNYSSSPQPLVASTRLQTQGKTYYILSEVLIPGATIEDGKQVPGKVEVVVEAENPGEEYNIGASDFIIPGLTPLRQKNIYGKSGSPMTGGSNKRVKIVTEEDLNKAKDFLLEEVYQEGIQKLESNIDNGYMIIPSATEKEIIELRTNGENEKEMENFEMEVRAKIITMSFNENDLRELVFENLNSELTQEKFFLNQDIKNGIDFEKKDFNIEFQKLDLSLHINKEVGWDIDEKMIKKVIKGKNKEETEKYLLDNSLGEEVMVDFWPFWVKKVPQIEKKIKIILDTSKNIDKIRK